MSFKIASEEDFKKQIAEGTVLVRFTASWCGPCKNIAPLYEELAAESKARFLTVSIEHPNMNAIAKRHGVTCVPYFIVFQDGQLKSSFFGAAPAKLRAEVAKLD